MRSWLLPHKQTLLWSIQDNYTSASMQPAHLRISINLSHSQYFWSEFSIFLENVIFAHTNVLQPRHSTSVFLEILNKKSVKILTNQYSWRHCYTILCKTTILYMELTRTIHGLPLQQNSSVCAYNRPTYGHTCNETVHMTHNLLFYLWC